MAWFNFTCRSGGSNMNAGATDGVGETTVATSLTNTNGAWVSGTGVFTCSGAPDLSGLVAGWLATVAPDADTEPTNNQFTQGRISAFDNILKTVTLTGLSSIGTVLTTGASGITLRVGGALLGPQGTALHPFNIAWGPNAGSSDPLRINLKNDQTYSITAGITFNRTSTRIQGYTTTFGDGGKFVLDGGTTGASYTLLTCSGANSELYDAEIRNNGATGTAAGLSVTGALFDLFRVTVHDVRGHGVVQGTARATFTEVLAYACNQPNTINYGGLATSSGVPVMMTRCVARDNTGSNTHGFYLTSNALFVLRDCIADTNGSCGITLTSTSPLIVTGGDIYANGSNGFLHSGASGTKPYFLTDCNFVGNGGYGVNGTGAGYANGRITNCAFGSGTAANTSGATNALGDTVVESSETYAPNVTPWFDPAATDFTPQGRALATGTGITNAGATISHPDRAAAQAEAGSVAGSGGGGMISSGF